MSLEHGGQNRLVAFNNCKMATKNGIFLDLIKKRGLEVFRHKLGHGEAKFCPLIINLEGGICSGIYF